MGKQNKEIIDNMEFLMKELHKEWDRSGANKASVFISLDEVEEVNRTLFLRIAKQQKEAETGNITFKKSDRSFLKDIPLDKILVETDSPYLSPEPFRGRVNEPKNVQYVIDKIALELGMTSEKLEKITTDNAKKFYGIG